MATAGSIHSTSTPFNSVELTSTKLVTGYPKDQHQDSLRRWHIHLRLAAQSLNLTHLLRPRAAKPVLAAWAVENGFSPTGADAARDLAFAAAIALFNEQSRALFQLCASWPGVISCDRILDVLEDFDYFDRADGVHLHGLLVRNIGATNPRRQRAVDRRISTIITLSQNADGGGILAADVTVEQLRRVLEMLLRAWTMSASHAALLPAEFIDTAMRIMMKHDVLAVRMEMRSVALSASSSAYPSARDFIDTIVADVDDLLPSEATFIPGLLIDLASPKSAALNAFGAAPRDHRAPPRTPSRDTRATPGRLRTSAPPARNSLVTKNGNQCPYCNSRICGALRNDPISKCVACGGAPPKAGSNPTERQLNLAKLMAAYRKKHSLDSLKSVPIETLLEFARASTLAALDVCDDDSTPLEEDDDDGEPDADDDDDADAGRLDALVGSLFGVIAESIDDRDERDQPDAHCGCLSVLDAADAHGSQGLAPEPAARRPLPLDDRRPRLRSSTSAIAACPFGDFMSSMVPDLTPRPPRTPRAALPTPSATACRGNPAAPAPLAAPSGAHSSSIALPPRPASQRLNVSADAASLAATCGALLSPQPYTPTHPLVRPVLSAASHAAGQAACDHMVALNHARTHHFAPPAQTAIQSTATHTPIDCAIEHNTNLFMSALEHSDYYGLLSPTQLLAFDARRTPFGFTASGLIMLRVFSPLKLPATAPLFRIMLGDIDYTDAWSLSTNVGTFTIAEALQRLDFKAFSAWVFCPTGGLASPSALAAAAAAPLAAPAPSASAPSVAPGPEPSFALLPVATEKAEPETRSQVTAGAVLGRVAVDGAEYQPVYPSTRGAISAPNLLDGEPTARSAPTRQSVAACPGSPAGATDTPHDESHATACSLLAVHAAASALSNAPSLPPTTEHIDGGATAEHNDGGANSMLTPQRNESASCHNARLSSTTAARQLRTDVRSAQRDFAPDACGYHSARLEFLAACQSSHSPDALAASAQAFAASPAGAYSIMQAPVRAVASDSAASSTPGMSIDTPPGFDTPSLAAPAAPDDAAAALVCALSDNRFANSLLLLGPLRDFNLHTIHVVHHALASPASLLCSLKRRPALAGLPDDLIDNAFEQLRRAIHSAMSIDLATTPMPDKATLTRDDDEPEWLSRASSNISDTARAASRRAELRLILKRAFLTVFAVARIKQIFICAHCIDACSEPDNLPNLHDDGTPIIDLHPLFGPERIEELRRDLTRIFRIGFVIARLRTTARARLTIHAACRRYAVSKCVAKLLNAYRRAAKCIAVAKCSERRLRLLGIDLPSYSQNALSALPYAISSELFTPLLAPVLNLIKPFKLGSIVTSFPFSGRALPRAPDAYSSILNYAARINPRSPGDTSPLATPPSRPDTATSIEPPSSASSNYTIVANDRLASLVHAVSSPASGNACILLSALYRMDLLSIDCVRHAARSARSDGTSCLYAALKSDDVLAFMPVPTLLEAYRGLLSACGLVSAPSRTDSHPATPPSRTDDNATARPPTPDMLLRDSNGTACIRQANNDASPSSSPPSAAADQPTTLDEHAALAAQAAYDAEAAECAAADAQSPSYAASAALAAASAPDDAKARERLDQIATDYALSATLDPINLQTSAAAAADARRQSKREHERELAQQAANKQDADDARRQRHFDHARELSEANRLNDQQAARNAASGIIAAACNSPDNELAAITSAAACVSPACALNQSWPALPQSPLPITANRPSSRAAGIVAPRPAPSSAAVAANTRSKTSELITGRLTFTSTIKRTKLAHASDGACHAHGLTFDWCGLQQLTYIYAIKGAASALGPRLQAIKQLQPGLSVISINDTVVNGPAHAADLLRACIKDVTIVTSARPQFPNGRP